MEAVERRRRRFIRHLSSLVFLFAAHFIAITHSISNIDELEGEAGFRMASLQWKYPRNIKGPVSFRVRYCELHTWGLHRCRYQVVDEVSGRSGRQETSGEESNEVFLLEIGGLRMATNYSFQVVPQDPTQKIGGKPSQIALQTKGFSAKATKCLADSSEVVVETGPFFGGRISVEDSTSPHCLVKGDPNSDNTKYPMRIRHRECGSIINGSRVTTVILVQENIPILTASTRRFVIVCSFSPDSFIVKAGVNLPRETSVAKSLDFQRVSGLPPERTNDLRPDDVEDDIVPSKRRGKLLVADPLYSGHANVLEAAVPNAYRESLQEARSGLPVGRSLKQTGGGWETALVFGMICVAIVASMGSVIWFARSYASGGTNSDHDFSSFNDEAASVTTSPSSTPNDEVEVELEFEFSEESPNTNSQFSRSIS